MNLPDLSNNELLIEIIKRTGSDTYLSGTGGKKYMDEELYDANAIRIVYNEVMVPEYPQINGEGFVPNLSIIDMMFNIGLSETRAAIRRSSLKIFLIKNCKVL